MLVGSSLQVWRYGRTVRGRKVFRFEYSAGYITHANRRIQPISTIGVPATLKLKIIYFRFVALAVGLNANINL